jgi:transcriptional regulator with XRE-family HTH domain
MPDDTRTPITRRSIRLRQAMLARGLTYDRLALALGIERTRLNRIGLEYITPRPEEARRIADALGLDAAEVFGAAAAAEPEQQG